MRAATGSIVVCLLAVFGCKSPEAGAGAGEAASSQAQQEQAEPGPKPTPRNKNQLDLPALPEVIATVAGHEIPRTAFEARYQPIAATILARRDDGRVPGPFQATQRRKIIEELAWSKQLELEAERSGVEFTAEALAEQEADERRHVRDWPAWLERIGQTPEIRRQANVDYLRERALLEARIGGSLDASEAELRAAYEQHKDKFVAPEQLVRASHLLITYGPRVADEKIQPPTIEQRDAASEAEKAKWNAAARARAQALRAAVLAPGVDFNEFAREWSEGPGAFRGGDMGLFPRRQMVAEYADVAFALEVGEVGEVVESEKGYYVIKSFGRYEAGPLPFEAVRADLVRQVEAEKFKQAHAALKAELDQRFPIVSAPLDEARAFLASK